MSKLDFIPDPMPEYGKARTSSAAERKYRESLRNLPERGGGLHGALQSVCNLGMIAGIPENVLCDEIRATGRAFKPHEIEDAIRTAAKGVTGHTHGKYESRGSIIGQRFKSDPTLAEKTKTALIHAGGGAADPFAPGLRTASNPPLPPPSGDLTGHCTDTIAFLSELYNPGDLLYIGSGKEKKGDYQESHIATAGNWIRYFSKKLAEIHGMSDRGRDRKIKAFGNYLSFVIINPLNGTQTEGGSLRTDANVTDFRFILCECDNTPLEQQIPLIRGLKLPVVSLTFSGGKSVHALIDAATLNGGKKIESLSEYKRLTAGLFEKIGPLGFDPATKNAARLSRLPGIWRNDKNTFQTLLYLNRRKGGTAWQTK